MNPDPRPTILAFANWYLPGFKAGGPIRSIENLVAALGGEFAFRIVTRDRDLKDNRPFSGIVPDQWVRVGRAEVMYLRPGLRGFLSAWRLLRLVDGDAVVYLNSFYARRFSMLAVLMSWLKLCRPRYVVLAPRGEFAPGAMRFKRLRKLLHIRISRCLGLYNNIMWHACTDYEVADIRRHFPQLKRIDIAIAIPGSDTNIKGLELKGGVTTASDIGMLALPRQGVSRPKKPGQLRVVFVARLARNKNLSAALKMLEGVSGKISFNIYGPCEDVGYWDECQRLIAALPKTIRVQYWGQIEHQRILRVFAEHDLFLFPTLGESYGHVIGEALAAGCPVLIGDQTPWRNLQREGVGWDFPPDQTECFRSVLQQCVDADGDSYAALSARAIAYATKRDSNPEVINANRRLFQHAFTWSTRGKPHPKH
jgi:glycosyltransferase involved in cell wall biosynthesis